MTQDIDPGPKPSGNHYRVGSLDEGMRRRLRRMAEDDPIRGFSLALKLSIAFWLAIGLLLVWTR